MAAGMPDIPGRLREKLLSGENWLGKTNTFLENLAPYWYGNPYFFPEYTVHGTLHVQHVLELLDRLIPHESLEALSARETALLVMSAAAHDVGMFLERDGVRSLLYGPGRNRKMDLLDQETWGEAWEGYLRRVKNLPDTELIKRFGEATQVTPPPEDMDKLTHRDILVYGDFLRQNHPRLAHDVLVNGLYGARTADLFRNTGLDRELRDLVGLICRSHGMALRDTEAYLRSNYGQARRPKNTQIFYLMSLVRLADYLDAGESRAPAALEDRQELRSQLSREEFGWNQSINQADYDWEPEREVLRIHAAPETGTEYVKIESWLRNVQEELDRCWAVLGEHYGRAAGACLSIRRVDSNLFCAETRQAYEKRFLTHPPRLGVNPDILKLLIAPLYGGDPSYGVRELLQNAVDACREREVLERQAGKEYRGEVAFDVDTKKGTFTILDNGVGMTAEVISKYFLVAGSSYRRSEEWAEHFVEDGKSKVARTGRFGIGVLAAFLIGSEVTVQTRHLHDSMGYAFQMHMDQENIDVVRCEMEVGTQVSILLDDEMKEYFGERSKNAWRDWYYLDSPKVTYWLDGEKYSVQPVFKNKRRDGWFDLPSRQFPSYRWSYHSGRFHTLILCNGIRIPEHGEKWYSFGEDTGWSISVPQIAIMDPENRVSVDLSRERLTEIPERKLLIGDIYRRVLARLLTLELGPDAAFWEFRYYKGQGSYEIYGISERELLLDKRGYTLAGGTFLDKAGIKDLNFACLRVQDYSKLATASKVPVVMNYQSKARKAFDFYKAMFNSRFERYKKITIAGWWVEKTLYDKELFPRLPKWVQRSYPKIGENATHYCLSRAAEDAALLSMDLDWDNLPTMFHCAVETPDTLNDPENIMRQVLDEYLGDDIWIPYDLKERKKKFPKAFKELKKYMSELD